MPPASFPCSARPMGELVVRSTSTLPRSSGNPEPFVGHQPPSASGVGSDRNVTSAASATSATEPLPRHPASVSDTTLIGSISKTVSR